METATVQLDDLEPYPGNARQHNIERIAESLSAHGQYRPLVVQRSTSRVLVGNGTAEAMKQMGHDTVEVVYVDVSDDEAARIVLVDNRTSDLATYDEEMLAKLLDGVEDLSGTAFSADEMDDLLSRVGAMPEVEEETFNGGLVEPHERGAPGPPLRTSGLKEVILVLRSDELAPFEAKVADLAQAWGTETVTATILEALKRAEG